MPASASVSYARIHVMQTCRPELSGVAPDRAVAGPLISGSDGTSRAR
ncbi:hypothetical protein QFZ49_003699 [Streptomyces turgidiscabies]|uniref:Uncharacterized protein n=1 Tax=Streptomyces turgidiscabies TaxID=85558 RepID=A0ABU0RP39_9ACTN|nr:hypothetical protein [Streptomyces turgidiscabies]